MTKFEDLTRGRGILENYLAKKRARMAESLIPDKLRQGRILDIGCGTTPYFLINTGFKEKYGIDPSLAEANSYNEIKLQRLDIVTNPRLPFQDNFFNVITMLAVIEHIEKDAVVSLLKEINRTLKPGGRFILTTPCPWADKLLKLMARLNLVSQVEIAEHKFALNHPALTNYLEHAGFKEGKIHLGYFELYFNNWGYAEK